MTDTTDIVAQLRLRHANVTGNDPRITKPIVGRTMFQDAADEIERLRKERDEARRMYLMQLNGGHEYYARLHSKDFGWDCFTEDADANNTLFRVTDGE